METVNIPKELYNKLDYLGLIPNDVRKGNVGKSDYSKRTIQPWSIWLDYQLNPWDADIVKRVLRTKDEAGMTPEEARIMDYQKIKHICDERIRQIEFETKAEEVIAKEVDSLYTLIGSEITKLTDFVGKHQFCGGVLETIFNGDNNQSTIIMRCPICGEQAEIAKYEVFKERD
jgi:hypothetical protein